MFNLISNNVKGLQSDKKRLKIFDYLKNKSVPNGILFLRETLSTKENEIRWNDDFKSQIHYSYGKSNSCGVLIAFFSTIFHTVRKKASDKHERIPIIEALIDDSEFISINLYNANTKLSFRD